MMLPMMIDGNQQVIQDDKGQSIQMVNNKLSQSAQSPIKIGNFLFSPQDIIGKGSFSKVYKGHDQSNQNYQVAIKVIQKHQLNHDLKILVDAQIKILKLVNHPNIVKCHEIKDDQQNIYVIMQLCDGGDLESFVDKNGPMNQNDAINIIKGVFNGLLYLSRNNIIHRDIKVANIFLHNGVAKIADFGFAVNSKTKKQFKDISIGSPIYMSPQGIKHNVYGPTTDVWSFGVFMYELLHGQTPYSHCTKQRELKYNISTQIGWYNLRANLSYSIKQVIYKCLQINYEKRVTFEKLRLLDFFRQQQKQDDRKTQKGGELVRRYNCDDQRLSFEREKLITYNKEQLNKNNRNHKKNQYQDGHTNVNNKKVKYRTQQSACIKSSTKGYQYSFIGNNHNRSQYHYRLQYQPYYQTNRSNTNRAAINKNNSKHIQKSNNNAIRKPTIKNNHHQKLTNNININQYNSQFDNNKNRISQTIIIPLIDFPQQNINCYLYLVHFIRLIYKLTCYMQQYKGLIQVKQYLKMFCLQLLKCTINKISMYIMKRYNHVISGYYGNEDRDKFESIHKTLHNYHQQYTNSFNKIYTNSFNHQQISQPSPIKYQHKHHHKQHQQHRINELTLTKINNQLQKEMNIILRNQTNLHQINSQTVKLLAYASIYQQQYQNVFKRSVINKQSKHWYHYNIVNAVNQIQTNIEQVNTITTLKSYLQFKTNQHYYQ